MALYSPGKIISVSKVHIRGRGDHNGSVLDLCSLSVTEDVQDIHS